MTERRPPPPQKVDNRHYVQLWRIVDGAVCDTFAMHPEYITGNREKVVRDSINKRVVGAVLGYATQVARARSDEESAGVTEAPLFQGGFLAKCLTALRQRFGMLVPDRTNSMRGTP